MMTGTVTAQPKARISNHIARIADKPNTVIAALVLSTCVAAVAGYVVTSRAFSYLATPTELSGVDTPLRPVPRPVAQVRAVILPVDAPTLALDFDDPEVARAAPAQLAAADSARTAACDHARHHRAGAVPLSSRRSARRAAPASLRWPTG